MDTNEEHRAALDWLNQITDSRFNFFGLEVEIWHIGTSPIAPKFNVVCKPNDWSKTVTEGAARVEAEALTESKALQLQFWTAFREYVLSQGWRIKPTKALPQNWMGITPEPDGHCPGTQWLQPVRCGLVLGFRDGKLPESRNPRRTRHHRPARQDIPGCT
jgi:hypothetical protein